MKEYRSGSQIIKTTKRWPQDLLLVLNTILRIFAASGYILSTGNFAPQWPQSLQKFHFRCGQIYYSFLFARSCEINLLSNLCVYLSQYCSKWSTSIWISQDSHFCSIFLFKYFDRLRTRLVTFPMKLTWRNLPFNLHPTIALATLAANMSCAVHVGIPVDLMNCVSSVLIVRRYFVMIVLIVHKKARAVSNYP